MDDIIDTVLCATIDDEPRFTKILKGLIKKKEIPDFPAFSKEGKSKKNARKRKVSEVRAQTSMSSGYFTLNSCYSFERKKKMSSKAQMLNNVFPILIFCLKNKGFEGKGK